MATAYVAFLTKEPADTDWPQGAGSIPENERERTGAFIGWVRSSVFYRAYALRTAVISLGFGVAFLPVGFIALGSSASATPPTMQAQIPWPSTPTQVADPDLQKILYQAQVQEVVAERTAALETKPTESIRNLGVRAVYIAFAIALLLTFFHPTLIWLLRKLDRNIEI